MIGIIFARMRGNEEIINNMWNVRVFIVDPNKSPDGRLRTALTTGVFSEDFGKTDNLIFSLLFLPEKLSSDNFCRPGDPVAGQNPPSPPHRTASRRGDWRQSVIGAEG